MSSDEPQAGRDPLGTSRGGDYFERMHAECAASAEGHYLPRAASRINSIGVIASILSLLAGVAIVVGLLARHFR